MHEHVSIPNALLVNGILASTVRYRILQCLGKHLCKAEREKRDGPKCNFKPKKSRCSYDAYLEANSDIKRRAELNLEMANREHIKLESID